MLTYRRNRSARSANREAPTAIRSIREISHWSDRMSRLERKQRKGHGARSKPRNNEAQRAWYKTYLETKTRIGLTIVNEESEHQSHPPMPKSVLNGAVIEAPWPSSQTVTEDVINQPAFAPPDAKVVAPIRRANRGARAVRELTSTLNGSYWLRPSTRRAPVRS